MIELHQPSDKPRQELTPQFLHDLRTPLNQIIGYAEMLAEQASQDSQTSLASDLKKIHTAGRQMAALLSGDSAETGDAVSEEVPIVERELRPSTDAASALILVVDDNRANRELLSARLERNEYAVMTAENGRQAMELVKAHAFDLILLDIMMPEVDGYEVLRWLKSESGLRNVPVIMISALDELDSVVRCVEMGAEDYLLKPFEPTLLKARIVACLEKKRARDREQVLYEQLNENYQRLKELETLRDDLTNMIVHDLRTPLSSLLAAVQTIEVAGELAPDQKEIVQIAISGGETLMQMINGLLDVDKMESGAMQLDIMLLDAGALVSGSVAQVAQLIEGKQQTLVQEIAEDLPPFLGDETMLQRTLVNLLGNAIKFTPAGGTVSIAARLAPDRGGIVFSVTDTGEGIPAESFERIFEKFGQVESRKAGRRMSTGLGLAFCRLAVQAHGGVIGVESVPASGSTFSFSVPLAPKDEPSSTG